GVRNFVIVSFGIVLRAQSRPAGPQAREQNRSYYKKRTFHDRLLIRESAETKVRLDLCGFYARKRPSASRKQYLVVSGSFMWNCLHCGHRTRCARARVT